MIAWDLRYFWRSVISGMIEELIESRLTSIGAVGELFDLRVV
jgi:hypothetical protein